MHLVVIQSHYGQPIYLDQCDKCGGIWFDQSELYRAKHGEAAVIESLDSDSLWASSNLENTVHVCPRDQAKLFRFTDKYFPNDVVVERCPKCDGFWLNRGEFTKFQKARQELQRQKETKPADTQLQENIRQLLAKHQSGGTDDVLGRLGSFLSTPVDERAQPSPKQEDSIGSVLNIVLTLLRLFVFK